jgi:hypothetical protein
LSSYSTGGLSRTAPFHIVSYLEIQQNVRLRPKIEELVNPRACDRIVLNTIIKQDVRIWTKFTQFREYYSSGLW